MNAALIRVFVRLVVCQSALERPLFTYTDLSRGGAVCVGVEAGAQQVFGFPWLTPKLFFGGVGGTMEVCVCVWGGERIRAPAPVCGHYDLYEPGTIKEGRK